MSAESETEVSDGWKRELGEARDEFLHEFRPVIVDGMGTVCTLCILAVAALLTNFLIWLAPSFKSFFYCIKTMEYVGAIGVLFFTISYMVVVVATASVTGIYKTAIAPIVEMFKQDNS